MADSSAPKSSEKGITTSVPRKRLSSLFSIPPDVVLEILMFFCFFLLCVLRLNISVSIVTMVNWTTLHQQKANRTHGEVEEGCQYNESSGNELKDGPFDWDTSTQGIILSSYFYGLTVTQLPGGILSEKYSAKWVLFIGTMLSSVSCLLCPLVVYTDWYFLVFLQIVKGAGQGIMVPALAVMVGNWVPAATRIQFMCLVTSGLPLGAFLSSLIYGYLCQSTFLGGWPLTFYVSGIAGVVWCLFWWWLVYDTPLSHPARTTELINRLMSLKTQQAVAVVLPATPWRKIMTSLPIWSYFFVGFSSFWTISLYNAVLPLYLGTILKYDIASNGLMASIPNLLQAFVMVATSFTTDYLQKRYFSKTSLIRKCTISMGLGGFALFMILTGVSGCHRGWSVFCLTMALGISGGSFAACLVIPMDLAPRYAGTISGIQATFGSLSGVIIPSIISALTQKQQTIKEWMVLFYVSGAICVFSILFNCVFGTSARQQWNYPSFQEDS